MLRRSPTAQPVGTATLSFDTCASGQLSYSFTDGTGRTGSIPLTRLTQNVTCSITTARPTNADFALSGNWYDPTTSGQGLTVEVNPVSGAFFAAWYTYAPNGAGAGAAGQRWYTAQAHLYAGLAFDSRDDLRNHRWVVRHTDASWPEHCGSGDRHNGIPELLGRDVELQLHRRKQHGLLRNDRFEPRRSATPWLLNANPRRTQPAASHAQIMRS